MSLMAVSDLPAGEPASVPADLPDAPLPGQIVLLAAIDRAVRHLAWHQRTVAARTGRTRGEGAPVFVISEHLGLGRSPSVALRRELRRQLDGLVGEGLLTSAVEAARPTWALTEEGGKLVARHRRKAWAVLPESPQHRAWREARELAASEIEALRADVHDTLSAAVALAEREPHDHASLDQMGRQLRGAFHRLAGASYCLYEWAEPDDLHADVDVRGATGALRNAVNWSHARTSAADAEVSAQASGARRATVTRLRRNASRAQASETGRARPALRLGGGAPRR